MSMSYAFPAPVAAPPTVARRPVTVTAAAVLLALMALGGLGYAVAALVVTPGIVEAFREAAGAVDPTEVDGYVTAVWVIAGIATVLAVILFALYAVLILGLRSGSPAARIGTWVVCGLGLAAGCASTGAVALQRGAESSDALLVDLGAAYPQGWIGLNLGLSVAQMLGYALVAVLLVASPRAYFHQGATVVPPQVHPQVHHQVHSAHPVQTHPAQQGYPAYHQPYQYPAPTPAPGPDDEYWSRPG
jgi:hypothetical protein